MKCDNKNCQRIKCNCVHRVYKVLMEFIMLCGTYTYICIYYKDIAGGTQLYTQNGEDLISLCH